MTGEVFKARLVPAPEEIIKWVAGLPGRPRWCTSRGRRGSGWLGNWPGRGCEVAAASKIQRPAGDRVKSDARDALHLARLLRLDEVVPVRVPTEAQECARDLVRCREAARADLMRSRHRLSKLLLRHGIVSSGGKAWTQAHDYWLLKQSFPLAGTAAAFADAYETVVLVAGRRDRLDTAIEAMAADSEFTAVVRRLSCLRAISTLTAFSLAVEIGDWDRFTGASIGAYLGLVPSEHSSGASRSQGGITKTGNGHARRLLVEAAWHHRKPYRPTAILRRRWELASPPSTSPTPRTSRRAHLTTDHSISARGLPRSGAARFGALMTRVWSGGSGEANAVLPSRFLVGQELGAEARGDGVRRPPSAGTGVVYPVVYPFRLSTRPIRLSDRVCDL
ncbi:MAG: IS110 family transposase [Lapillicoccus sp.]